MKNKSGNKIMEPTASRKPGSIERRDFLKYLGGGILIIFTPLEACKSGSETAPVSRTLPKDFNAFLHIAQDGLVTCFVGKIEMGQGVITALAQIAAEELDVPLDRVKMVMGDTELCPYDEGTWGSLTVREFGPKLREAAAEARDVLVLLASEHLKLPASQLQAVDGVVYDKSDKSRSVTYASLAKGQKIEKHLTGAPRLKTPSEFKTIGKSHKRLDSLEKVTGEARYTGDIKLEGMLHTRIVRPASFGAKLVSADTSEAEKIEGIQVIRDGDLIALLHENRDKVDEAIVRVKAEFTPVEINVNDRTIPEHYLKTATGANVTNSKGDINAGRKLAAVITESDFFDGYVAHSPIEPHTAAAIREGDKLTVWASAQPPFLTRDEISESLGIPAEKVRVIVPFVGGGFGGKIYNPQAIEAARIAWVSGKPVMLAYTREEEFIYDYLRPAGLVKVSSGTDKDGKITFWDYRVYCAGDRGAETLYDVPHQKLTTYDQAGDGPQVHPFATGAWRAPGASNNVHAREMQICIMAAKAGMDQMEFRMKNLADERMRDVLKAAAEKFGYTPGKNPSGRGFGMACGIDVDTYVVVMVEVKVDKASGKIQVVRASCAQDMGMCVNPEGSLLQIEGCITMGLGYSLSEEVKFEGTTMNTVNFDTYSLPKFSWVPEIDAVILDKMDQPPHGGGEPAVICMGGAIASAVYDATGAIIYDMPLTPAKVLEALKKV
jgi:isoquinoline 1-oxidoreductase